MLKYLAHITKWIALSFAQPSSKATVYNGI